jgi:hypothetical protein
MAGPLPFLTQEAEAPTLGPRPGSYVLADVRFLLRGYHPLPLVSLAKLPLRSCTLLVRGWGSPAKDTPEPALGRAKALEKRGHAAASAAALWRIEKEGEAQRGTVGPPSGKFSKELEKKGEARCLGKA